LFAASTFFILILAWTLTSTGDAKSRNQLTIDLMEHYDSKVRASASYNSSVRVKFKLFLNQLLDVVSVVENKVK